MINLIPYAFKVAEQVLSAAKEATTLERALYTEVIHNCAWLGALDGTARANDPRFVDAIASLRIDAHEAFLASSLGEGEAIAVKPAKAGAAKASKKPRLGTRDIPITLELADDEESIAVTEATRHRVVLSQAVAYVVHQVLLMRTIVANRGRVGDLLRDVQGGRRAQNLAAVEHAIRIALGQVHSSVSPKAGKNAVQPKPRTQSQTRGGAR